MGTRWVGLELEFSIIFMRTVGRFNMWVTPYTGILTLANLKYFMSKDLSTKTLWSCTAANNTRRDSERGTRSIICKCQTRYAYTKLWLKHESLMTLMKLKLGFLCWTVLIFWNTSGGYLTQTFNSQTLRGDLK